MTCRLCKGTRVVDYYVGFGWLKQGCTECGPVSAKEAERKKQTLEKRIQEAERIFGVEDKEVS